MPVYRIGLELSFNQFRASSLRPSVSGLLGFFTNISRKSDATCQWMRAYCLSEPKEKCPLSSTVASGSELVL
jgi:hypothetical protein